jgi:hypothetical protein
MMPSSAQTFSTWVASKDWVSWSWVWSSLRVGEVDDDVVEDRCGGCWGEGWRVDLGWRVGV